MRRSSAAFVLALLACGLAVRGFASGAASDEGLRAVVNTGHIGAVLAMEYDEPRDLLFSAGEDGTVRVWQPKTNMLVHRLQVTDSGAALIAVDPSHTRIAVLETDGARSFAISVWDWEAETRLFRIPVSEAPLFLRYSGAGSYLVLGLARWESLRIVSALDGTPVSFHPDGFGIVSFAEIGRSENRIVTYQPSGLITYWELATGAMVLQLKGAPNLSDPRISRDQRFLVGTNDKEMVVVDLITGAVRARANLMGLSSADVSLDGAEISSLSGAGGSTLERFGFSGETLSRRAPLSLGDEPCTILRYGRDAIYVSGPDGRIRSVSAEGEIALFARNELAEASSMDLADGRLAVAGKAGIAIFEHGFFDLAADPQTAEPRLSRLLLSANPLGGSLGLSFLGPDTLLVWGKGDERRGFGTLDIAASLGSAAGAFPPGAAPGASSDIAEPGAFPLFLEAPVSFQSALADLEPSSADSGSGGLPETLFALEKSGIISVLERESGATVFTAWLPGAATLASGSTGGLVAGRTVGAASEGSILRIDPNTGETVSIRNRNLFTYELLYDSARGVLYSIGLDAEGRTNLLRHEGRNFEQELVIDSFDGEDLFAGLSLDTGTSMLFSSLGGGLSVWDGASLARLPDSQRIPRKVHARGGMVFTLNKDSTVSVWDSARLEPVAELSVFSDGEWCVVLSDGRYMASEGAIGRVNLVNGPARN